MPHDSSVQKEKEVARFRFELAVEDFHTAVETMIGEHYRAANNRSYYAMFHAISACLALRGKTFRKHGQAIGAFNKEFVHAGIFLREIGRKAELAKDIRHASDYDDFFSASKAQAAEQIEDAREVLSSVAEFLNREGVEALFQ